MIRRLVLLGCLAVAIVLSRPTASYAEKPSPPGPPCFPDDVRAGCKGNIGPAGPAGAFDTRKLYNKGCESSSKCACEAGDFALVSFCRT
jgi:hypothetical protein